MTRNARYNSLLIILLFLGICSSCTCGDDAYEYTRAPENSSSNLNMKGEPLRATSAEDMKCIQEGLKYLGYDPGPANGCCSPQTKQAIKRFQIEHGLPSDGAVGPLTEQSMLKAIRARTALQKNTPASVRPASGSNP